MMINIGDIVQTSQFPHTYRRSIKVLKLLNGTHIIDKKEQLIVACIDLDDGTKMNLLYNKLFKKDDEEVNEEELRLLALKGNREAKIKYIKIFKKLPK